jgi:gliding motility associated protien GldN
MKIISLKIVVLVAMVSLTNINLIAQKKGKAPVKKSTGSSNPFGGGTTTPTPKSNNPFGGGATTQPPAGGNPFGGSSTTQPAKSGGNPFGASAAQPPAGSKQNGGNAGLNVPIEVVKSTGSNDPLNDSNRPSLRNESAIISNIKDRMPLPYDDIREDDAIYRQRLWKIIDAREKINAPFKYNSTEDNGSQLFFSILFRAVTEDSVVAFEDERFTQPYKNISKFREKFSGGVDTSDKFDLDNNLIGKEVRTREFPIDSIYSFQVKEEIIFDKEAARLVHRIVGIAPMGPLVVKGKVYPGPHFPYFWIYYPDVRKTLAKKQVFNAKNMGARMTWEDYLENQMYSYYIVKSSMDNVRDQKLNEYITDPLFRLLEGDKIKEKIFNYEQGLWAY